VHLVAADVDEEEHEEREQAHGGEYLRGEKVSGDEGVLVRGDEVGPGDLGLASWRRWYSVTAQDVADISSLISWPRFWTAPAMRS
jgi:hypothetical protein